MSIKGFGYGNAGFAANERAAFALLMTQIATSTSALSWLMTEWAIRKHPSFLAVVSGAVAGLVAITPASGCNSYKSESFEYDTSLSPDVQTWTKLAPSSSGCWRGRSATWALS